MLNIEEIKKECVEGFGSNQKHFVIWEDGSITEHRGANITKEKIEKSGFTGIPYYKPTPKFTFHNKKERTKKQQRWKCKVITQKVIVEYNDASIDDKIEIGDFIIGTKGLKPHKKFAYLKRTNPKFIIWSKKYLEV
jgi:hypothetical protein